MVIAKCPACERKSGPQPLTPQGKAEDVKTENARVADKARHSAATAAQREVKRLEDERLAEAKAKARADKALEKLGASYIEKASSFQAGSDGQTSHTKLPSKAFTKKQKAHRFLEPWKFDTGDRGDARGYKGLPVPTECQAEIDNLPAPVIRIAANEYKQNFKDYILVEHNVDPENLLVGFVKSRGHFPGVTFMSSVFRWRNKHGAKKRRFDVKSGFAHMYHICHAFKKKQNQSSSTDADDPETLWKRHCADANFRSQGDNPKVRYEVFVLKEEALRQGLSPDLWSEEVERITILV